jgi:type IV pilus assembly protein PilB
LRLGDVLLNLGYIGLEDLLRARAFQMGLAYDDLSNLKFDDSMRKLIPSDMASKFKIMPISKDDSTNTITIAMAAPNDLVAVEEVQNKTNKKVVIILSSEENILKSIEKNYGGLAAGLDDLSDINIEEVTDEENALDDGGFEAEDAPIIKYVNTLFYEAVIKNSSDIHLEPLEKTITLRLRVDGKLRTFPGPDKNTYPAIVSRIKIMSNLDIAERRLPQDGKCRIIVEGQKIDVRVSTMPVVYGEKLVMRILKKSGSTMELANLGFSDVELETYMDALKEPHGMILVTGPTGSGKTTSLYAGLNNINVPDKNIITIEDPVEYELSGINQVQVKTAIDLTFANVLRAVLRQDPDVVMVGEIRDKVTAEIAVEASLTGHLVLSTLHTNDAVSTLSRLKYMGVDTYLIADAVELVMAQRLVRSICPDCKQEQDVTDKILKKLNLQDGQYKFYQGVGCDECLGMGYKGRVGIYEMLRLTPEIKRLIMEEANDIAIKNLAVEQGMTTLRQAGIQKLIAGITTVEEVLTVTLH